jgi:predicted RNase H-like HicB family nuclease
MTHRVLPVVFFPAPDVPGEWVAHCLPIDVVSQGHSLEHAGEMIQEAVALCVLMDAKDGVDPLVVRRPAPPEYWEMFDKINKRLVPLEDLPDDSQARGAAGYLTVSRPQIETRDGKKSDAAPARPPLVFAGAEPRDSQLVGLC